MIVQPEALSILDFLKRLRKKFDIFRDLTEIPILAIQFTADHLRIFEECGEGDDFYNTNDTNIIDYVFSYLNTFLKFQNFLRRSNLSTDKADNIVYEVLIRDNTIKVFIEKYTGMNYVTLTDENLEERKLYGPKIVHLDVLSLYELTLDWQRWKIYK